MLCLMLWYFRLNQCYTGYIFVKLVKRRAREENNLIPLHGGYNRTIMILLGGMSRRAENKWEDNVIVGETENTDRQE
jgi:hypothetical protein